MLSYSFANMPRIEADFATGIDDAIAELKEYPFTALEREMRGVRRFGAFVI